MKIEDLLRRKRPGVITVKPRATIKNAADKLRMENIAALVVVEGEAILGIVSEREIVRALSRHGDEIGSMYVKDIMIPSIACSPLDGLQHAMSIMTQRRMRHVIVLQDKRLAGIISIGDVVKHRLSDLELETGVLRDAFLATH